MPWKVNKLVGERATVERRRFLKTAATLAPLVATLPNGAAQATGSTSQCILDNITNSEQGAITPVVSSPPPPNDGYFRVTANQVTFSRQLPGFPPRFDTQVTFELTSYPGRFFLDTGVEFFPEASSPAFTEAARVAVSVLQHYQPDDRTDPLTVGPCVPGTNDTLPSCLYPVSQFDPNDNIGMTISCLVSVSA